VSENGKTSWLSSPATVITVLTVILNIMGFLSVRTFFSRMCLPTNYFENSAIDYLQWGVKAVVALVISIVIVTLVVAIITVIGALLSFLIRKTLYRFKIVKELQDKLILTFRTRIQSISVPRLTGILFLLSFFIFIIFGYTQSQVILGFTDLPDCQSVNLYIPSVFNSANKTFLSLYQFYSSALIIILSLALFLSIRLRQREGEGKIYLNIFTYAIFSLWLFALAFWAMPYRLISHNEFEATQYNNSKAYIISEKESRLFLYVPGERPFLIEKNDTLLNRTGKVYYENIFNN